MKDVEGKLNDMVGETFQMKQVIGDNLRMMEKLEDKSLSKTESVK